MCVCLCACESHFLRTQLWVQANTNMGAASEVTFPITEDYASESGRSVFAYGSKGGCVSEGHR
jgi:hypothetical protein